MTFPFTELTEAARQAGLVVAVLIGIAFGFVLERAGFGRADKLAAQFYLRDMRVFKVMFTAIVTAMLGLVIAAGLGLTNLREISESIASWTWIWPMLVGGFVLGVGFIVSGYCPGTSVVATASGSIDGLFTVLGVISGTFIYSELLRIPSVQQFHNSGEKGAWFLYDLVPVPPQLLAAAVAVMAILAFIGAEKVEAMLGGTRTAKRMRRLAFASVATVAVIALVTVFGADVILRRGAPKDLYAGSSRTRVEILRSAQDDERQITAAELARVIVDEPWKVRVIDTRDAAAFGKERIPGSQNLSAASLRDLPADDRAIVVVGEVKDVPRGARLLAGGIAAWNADPLVRAMTSGAPPPPPPAPVIGAVMKPRKKGGGCSS